MLVNFDDSELQYSFTLYPNFKKDESIVIYHTHHGVSDGIGVVMQLIGFMDISTEEKLERAPRLSTIPALSWIIGLLLSPILIPIELSRALGTSIPKGPLHKSRNITGRTTGYHFKEPLNLLEMKKFCRA